MENRLLDASDLDLARQLTISVKRRATNPATGEQRSPSLGGGIEFADYREYIPGDDIRQVDWTIFRRLRKLMIKQSAEEKELSLMLILDNSRSMHFGDRDKLVLAKRVCAILCGIAMHSGNRAGLLSWGSNLKEVIPPRRNLRSLSFLSDRINAVSEAQTVDYDACMRQFASRYGRRCVAVLVSDLLYPEWPHVLSSLAASGCESHVIQILCPSELDPLPQGEVTFVDSENGTEVPMHVNAKNIEDYRLVLRTYLDEILASCRSKGIGHTQISSDRPLAAVFHQDLRKGGLVC